MSKKPGKAQKSAAVRKAAAAAAGKRKGPKPQRDVKRTSAEALGRIKALQSAAEAKRAAAKRRISLKEILIIGGGACALAVLFLLIYFSPAGKDAPSGAPPGASPQVAIMPPGSVPGRPAAPPPELSRDDRTDFPVIRTIRFKPSQPTRMDTLKAEVLAEAPDPERLAYAFVWKVNDRRIENAESDTLDLSSLDLKKRDLITVTVTPSDGEREGFSVESPVIAVHSIAPTLDLHVSHRTRKASEPLEMQLVSVHPDSDGVTFSLEAPIVPGMSIDPKSGKITWIIQPGQQGTIRFGAVVEDTVQTRVARIFEVTVEKSTVAAAPERIVERRSMD